MLLVIIIIAIISFLATFLITPKLMKFLKGCGIVAIDQQKKNKPLLPGSGGLCVAFGLLGGIMGYITINTFILKNTVNLVLLLAASSTILIITLVGVLDDLNTRYKLNKNKSGIIEYRVGLKQWIKPVLTLLGAVPLMAIKAGESIMVFPIIGKVDFGILYPLVLVPVAVVCVSNTNNMLAGMNGLEAGLGFVASISIGIFIFLFTQIEGSIIAISLAMSLLAFLIYNWYPAKILPGDSLTYLIGATFVTAIIIGNIEAFAILIYLPWIAEAFLKLRGKFAVSSLGVLQKDGTLKSQYTKIYSLTHLVMRLGRFSEKQVTSILISALIIIAFIGFLVKFLFFLP